MSTTINKATAIIDSTEFDEETWLIEPPNLSSTQSNSIQESGRIVEWLQGAAMNVDFQTRSALSRKLASQAARKKKRAEKIHEKAESVGGYKREHLAQVKEEMMEMNQIYGDKDDKDVLKGNTPKWYDNNSMNKKYQQICYEGKQQQHDVTTTITSTTTIATATATTTNAANSSTIVTSSTVSPLLSTENMALITNDNDNDDDDSDEFYDASSDFNNDMLFSSTTTATTTTITDSANIISSTIASQNDSRGKVISNGTSLAAINECIKSSADSSANSSISLLNSDPSIHESRQVRQVNTARVPPMIAQNHASQRSSVLDKSKSLYRSTKSHSPSTQPDLKDIKSIVERQEAELREELSRLKSSVQGDIASKTFSSCAHNSQVQSTRRGTMPLASSRSTEFHANNAKLSAVSIPSSVFHASRLPTPVRKSLGRSLIPTPRASALTRSTIRGLAGGSTPSLALSAQHLYDDTRSECGSGGMSHNEQRWADECF
ncbi:Uncharacterized protein BM_BM10241 [Brugia malayi]|uniref:Bm10241 n=2 Tax=Brugia malayi TaxID=6279 RepID=A0A4E9F7S4_BRUMA|nr:Uncharacterized protein BM_BM10241 [Brugia malayi]VIO92884.1 Uncharacterized protein BM_BM10241 [Brugia malayi]